MKTLTDWKLHSWYRTRDGRKAWLAAIAIGPDGETVVDYPLMFCLGKYEIWYADINGQYRDGQLRDCDIIGPWVDDPRPFVRYCPVKHPPTEADGDHVLVDGGLSFPYTAHTRCVLERPTAYKWWCPLKPILEMEVQK